MSVSGESPRASVLRSTGTPPPADGAKRQAPFDPLRLCIYTAIAVLAWLLTPPLVVVWMATLGLLDYARAYRQGLTRIGRVDLVPVWQAGKLDEVVDVDVAAAKRTVAFLE